MSLNLLGYTSHLYCNVAILPMVTKDLPISPRFLPYDFLSPCKFSTLTTRQPVVKESKVQPLSVDEGQV